MCHPKFPIHQEPPNLHRLDKFFALGFPNCEEPESYRPCHNLNPYRHRHYAPEGYSCYTLDKPQGINVLLFLLFLLYCYGCVYKKPHPPGTFKLTQPDKVFYFGVPHSLERPEDSRGCHNLNGQDSPGAGRLLYGKFTGNTYKG